MEETSKEQFNSIESLAQQLKEYEILKPLGSGGMGVVLLAKHRLTDRLEVIKVLRPDLASRAKLRERFLREVKLAAMLDHPNVVKTYTAVQVGDVLGLVMEHIDGLNLDTIVSRNGPMRIATAISVMQQAASGLEHASQRGLIHRDIKPSNILVQRVGSQLQAKISDFGLSKAEEDETDNTTNLTVAGRFLGTPDYMAPEQGLDASQATTASDIYGLGCTMYFALTGKPPYSGANALAVLNAHLTKPIPDIRLFRSEVPEALAHLLNRMLQKDPQQRCSSPREVIEALRNINADALPSQTAATQQPEVSAKPAAFVATESEASSSGVSLEGFSSGTGNRPPLSPAMSRVKPRPRKRSRGFAWSTLMQLLIPIMFLGVAYYYFRPTGTNTDFGTLRLVELISGVTIEIDGSTQVEADRVNAKSREIPLRVGQHTLRVLYAGRVTHEQEVTIKPNGTIELSIESLEKLKRSSDEVPREGNLGVNPRGLPKPSNTQPSPAQSSPAPDQVADSGSTQEDSSSLGPNPFVLESDEPTTPPPVESKSPTATETQVAPEVAPAIADQSRNWELKVERSIPALMRPASALSIVSERVSTTGNPLLVALAPDVQAWDFKTGNLTPLPVPMSRLRRIEVASNEKSICYIDRYFCEVWIKKVKPELWFKPLRDMNVEREYAMSADCRFLACCGFDQQFTSWNLQSKTQFHQMSAKKPMATQNVKAIQFTPRLDTVVVLGMDGALLSWNTADGETLGSRPGSDSEVIGMHVSGTRGKVVCVHNSGLLAIYKLPSLQPIEEFQLPLTDIRATAMSNKVLICADGQARALMVDVVEPASMGTIEVVSANTKPRPGLMGGRCVAIATDSRSGAVALEDGTIHIILFSKPR